MRKSVLAVLLSSMGLGVSLMACSFSWWFLIPSIFFFVASFYLGWFDNKIYKLDMELARRGLK
jgi:hypothetical protein